MQLSFDVPTSGLGFQFERYRHDMEVVELAITLYQQGLSFVTEEMQLPSC